MAMIEKLSYSRVKTCTNQDMKSSYRKINNYKYSPLQGRPVGGSGGSAEPPVLGWVPSRTGWVGEGWKEKKRGRKKEKEAKK